MPTCISCNVPITNDGGSATFPCPKCTQQAIVRCKNCRKTAARYTCPACKFSGPN